MVVQDLDGALLSQFSAAPQPSPPCQGPFHSLGLFPTAARGTFVITSAHLLFLAAASKT